MSVDHVSQTFQDHADQEDGGRNTRGQQVAGKRIRNHNEHAEKGPQDEGGVAHDDQLPAVEGTSDLSVEVDRPGHGLEELPLSLFVLSIVVSREEHGESRRQRPEDEDPHRPVLNGPGRPVEVRVVECIGRRQQASDNDQKVGPFPQLFKPQAGEHRKCEGNADDGGDGHVCIEQNDVLLDDPEQAVENEDSPEHEGEGSAEPHFGGGLERRLAKSLAQSRNDVAHDDADLPVQRRIHAAHGGGKHGRNHDADQAVRKELEGQIGIRSVGRVFSREGVDLRLVEKASDHRGHEPDADPDDREPHGKPRRFGRFATIFCDKEPARRGQADLTVELHEERDDDPVPGELVAGKRPGLFGESVVLGKPGVGEV